MEEEQKKMLETWREDHAEFVKTHFRSQLAIMHGACQRFGWSGLLARVDKVTRMLKAPKVDMEEAADAYNQLARDVTSAMDENKVLHTLMKYHSNYSTRGMMFTYMHQPVEWLRVVVDNWCGFIELLPGRNGVSMKEVADFFRRLASENDGEGMTPAWWGMLKVLAQTATVICDTMQVVEDIPGWFRKDAPGESEAMDKVKKYLEDMPWTHRVRVHVVECETDDQERSLVNLRDELKKLLDE